MNIEKINNAYIVDVRTPGEFSMGHVTGSINIPLNELPERIEELKSMNGKSFCVVPPETVAVRHIDT